LARSPDEVRGQLLGQPKDLLGAGTAARFVFGFSLLQSVLPARAAEPLRGPLFIEPVNSVPNGLALP
jgi:hypothetical protein